MHDYLNVAMCNKAYQMAHLDSNSCLSSFLSLIQEGCLLSGAEVQQGLTSSLAKPLGDLACSSHAQHQLLWTALVDIAFMCGVQLLDGTYTLFLPAVH